MQHIRDVMHSAVDILVLNHPLELDCPRKVTLSCGANQRLRGPHPIACGQHWFGHPAYLSQTAMLDLPIPAAAWVIASKSLRSVRLIAFVVCIALGSDMF
jgi:hypothetical protein